MVAMLQTTASVEDRIDRTTVFGEPAGYTEAWQRDRWKGRDPHLALLLDPIEEEIRWLGRAQGGRQLTTVDRLVSVTEILELDEPVGLDLLEGELSARHERVLQRRGILPPRGGEAVVAALSKLRPEYAEDIDRLSRPATFVLPPGRRGQTLALERDAVGVLLELGGMARRPLRLWSSPPPSAASSSFLAGLPETDQLEDTLIAYDAERFGDWVREPTTRLDWRLFKDGRREMLIMNANRTAVERTLGVDVVYYNKPLNSFVLVQYKRMIQRGKTPAAYRPDKNLIEELKRMRRIDALSEGSSGEFRLMRTPCWLKLCEAKPVVADPTELIKGMYLAREHFEELMARLKGPKGGIVFSYDNVPRYLTNTLFLELVKEGWVGSQGDVTADIAGLVEQSLRDRHSVLIGLQQ